MSEDLSGQDFLLCRSEHKTHYRSHLAKSASNLNSWPKHRKKKNVPSPGGDAIGLSNGETLQVLRNANSVSSILFNEDNKRQQNLYPFDTN